MYTTKALSKDANYLAPDGSEVRLLVKGTNGSMAHFHLPPNHASKAIHHRTVEEVWYIVDGYGEMWREHGDTSSIELLEPGVSLTIPVGTHFQFRSGRQGMSAIGVTMPPWPGDDEAVFVEGVWEANAD